MYIERRGRRETANVSEAAARQTSLSVRRFSKFFIYGFAFCYGATPRFDNGVRWVSNVQCTGAFQEVSCSSREVENFPNFH